MARCVNEGAEVPALADVVRSWDTLAAQIADRLRVAAVADGDRMLSAIETYLRPWLAGEASADEAVANLVAGRSASSVFWKHKGDLRRMRTARHEAGHAVAAWVLGVGITYLTAEANPGSLWSGEVQLHTHGNGAITTASREHQAVIFLAGTAAESVTELTGARLSQDDYAQAVEAVFLARLDMADAEGEALFTYCAARADALVRRHWPAVVALADAVYDAGEVYGSEAVSIMESAMVSASLAGAS